MHSILYGVTFWFPALVGWGMLSLRVLSRTGFSHGSIPFTLGGAGLCGIVALTTITTLLNFFFPITSAVSVGLLFLGLTFLLFFRKTFVWQKSPLSESMFLLTLLLVGAWILSIHPPGYDAGLYHLQSIKWTREHALPLGLANLHDRFGFNSSWFVFAAALGIPGLGLDAAFLTNILVLFFFFAFLIQESRNFSRQLVPWAAMIVLAYFCVSNSLFVFTLVGPSTDGPAFIYGFAALLCFARWFQKDGQKDTESLLVVFSFFVLTIKTSTLILPAGVCAAILGLGYFGRSPAVRPFLLLLGIVGIAVPWMIRGYLLSGCFLFPATASCFSKAFWSVPHQSVQGCLDAIVGWARMPYVSLDQVPSGFGWVSAWKERTLSNPLVRFSLAAILSGTVAILWASRGKKLPSGMRIYAVILSLSVIGIGQWFFSAPDPRFGLVFILSAGVFTLALGLSHLPASVSRLSIPRSLLYLAGATLLGTKVMRLGVEPTQGHSWPHVPQAAVITRPLPDGTPVFVPMKQDSDQCWTAELPCTPYWDKGLRVKRSSLDGRLVFYRVATDREEERQALRSAEEAAQ